MRSCGSKDSGFLLLSSVPPALEFSPWLASNHLLAYEFAEEGTHVESCHL